MNQRLSSSTRTGAKSKTTMTTDDEIERIREIRARRQRAERKERKDDYNEKVGDSSLTSSSTMSGSVRRPSRRTSIARQDLEKAGLVRKSSRGTISPKSSEGISSSGDEYSSSDTTKSKEFASRRSSDIQARLAARRNRRNNSEGSYKSTTSVNRRDSGISQTSTDSSSEQNVSRTTRRKSSNRSGSSERMRGSAAKRYMEASVNPAVTSRSADKALTKGARSEDRAFERKRNRGENPAVLAAMEPYDSRENSKSKPQSLPPRSSSVAISERLKERREARERDRKEREKKYDLKGLSTSSELKQRNQKGTERLNRDENKSRAKEKNDQVDYREHRESERLKGKKGEDRSTTNGNNAQVDLSTELKDFLNSNPVAAKSKDRKRNSGVSKSRIPKLHVSDKGYEEISDEWTLRLCVISATDLPFNIVPNMPLCPIIKMGLINLAEYLNENAEKKSITTVVMKELGDNGIETVQSANVRSTTYKILSRRDNGSVDFHQEYRWDNLKEPQMMGLCIELFARAVRTPSNYMLSPLAKSQDDISTQQINSAAIDTPPPVTGVNRTSTLDTRGLWNRNNKKQNAEMQAAEAAAAVARILVDDENRAETKNREDLQSSSMKKSDPSNSDYDVSLRLSPDGTDIGLTKDVRLGSVVIPLTRLPTGKGNKEAIRLEEWYQLENYDESIETAIDRKKPSVFLEISLSSSEVLDDSEDELEESDNIDGDGKESFRTPSRLNPSFSRRACIEALNETNKEEIKKEKTKIEDPVLDPGVIDFVAVVGCKDIGNQKNDDGMRGWVKTTPECVVLEQFPPNNEFHLQSGRKALLPEMLQWFCYPEGARLWRGIDPPSPSDLKLKQFSGISTPNVISSTAAFDACLSCTTSFSWFVIASNSDEYGSSLVKTYGAVIRFYVPAPTGIDSTQDDFAQAIMGGKPNKPSPTLVKRLWVPIAICLTSNLPIVGIMEALLLRTCEELAAVSDGFSSSKMEEIQRAIGNIILNYQKPIAGAVNCSVPFLIGDRFLLSLPPRTCLPPLPHGGAIVSVCRLLGAEGLNYLIAAVLTECKILLHSEDIAEIAMVAEVITALTYPFAWSLPYIPVLPIGMIEFVEAPLSYLLGIPSCNLKLIDPRALDDTIVFDLNKKFSPSEFSHEKAKSKSAGNKHPPPLPTSLSTNLTHAVYKLLHAEEQMEEEYNGFGFLEHSFPRLDNESLAEREFRVTIAIEICGLLRGYQDCVGPVFNRDKFLKTAPALYEERREYKVAAVKPSGRSTITEKTKVLSSRSKRFLSSLVNGQNFQQFIEILDSEEASFFHEVMEAIDESNSDKKSMKRTTSDDIDFSQADKIVTLLMKSLQKIEDKIPTFCVENGGSLLLGDATDETLLSSMYGHSKFDDFDGFFPEPDTTDLGERNSFKLIKSLLSPIEVESTSAVSASGMQALSMDYLAKLEKSPWNYNPLFLNLPQYMKTTEKIKLREAIGDRRFRAWKLQKDKKSNHDEDLAFLSESASGSAKQGSALNLTTLVTSAKNDSAESSLTPTDTMQSRMPALTPAQQRIAAAKSRDIIRRCLDRAHVVQCTEGEQVNPFLDNGRDLMAEAEKALRNPSAQLFLVSILAQRSRLDNKRTRTMRQSSSVGNSASRLDHVAFDCLIRLSCAMLDSCMEFKEFEMAYRLLTNSAGFIMIQEVANAREDVGDEYNNEQSMVAITMTSRIGLHPIFADIGVWETVMVLHLRDRKAVKKSDEFKSYSTDSDDEVEEEVEYEAAVATLYEMVGYGIPGEELSRFAMQVSQEHGWFCDDRGRQLLMLARRISIRRDQAGIGATGDTGDIDMVRKGPDVVDTKSTNSEGYSEDNRSFVWGDVAWCHPAAPSGAAATPESVTDLDMASSVDNFIKRTPVTALAPFGSSAVASGGLDGGVFLAYSIKVGLHSHNYPKVKGIHLDWGSASRARTGSTSDGEYGVGAVSCLAAAYGDTSHDLTSSPTKDAKDAIDRIDMAESLEGSRIIAGTTAGDLRVWSVKDVYSSIFMAKNDQEASFSHTTSRFKHSLRGKALSGHRGGVTCIDVPSQVYRPDSLVTGGADGLIKLWALRAPSGSRRASVSSSEVDVGAGGGQQQRGRGGDALNTLFGHTGRILCIKTAWHGDHLLSGGADRTIRIWDLATSGGRCIHTLCGHFGWITNVQYWGPNTIVSASTDRSVALWDARVRSSPLFILRNHQSPVSDLLVGARTDPHMVSAAADGTIATWDFRSLSETTATELPGTKGSSNNRCRIVRQPSVSICHNGNARERAVGSIRLQRDVNDPINSFLSVGSDAILRKWDITTGNMMKESPTGHCDAITSFESYASNPTDVKGKTVSSIEDKGFLTASLDGTIRMRKLIGTRDN